MTRALSRRTGRSVDRRLGGGCGGHGAGVLVPGGVRTLRTHGRDHDRQPSRSRRRRAPCAGLISGLRHRSRWFGSVGGSPASYAVGAPMWISRGCPDRHPALAGDAGEGPSLPVGTSATGTMRRWPTIPRSGRSAPTTTGAPGGGRRLRWPRSVRASPFRSSRRPPTTCSQPASPSRATVHLLRQADDTTGRQRQVLVGSRGVFTSGLGRLPFESSRRRADLVPSVATPRCAWCRSARCRSCGHPAGRQPVPPGRAAGGRPVPLARRSHWARACRRRPASAPGRPSPSPVRSSRPDGWTPPHRDPGRQPPARTWAGPSRGDARPAHPPRARC